MSDSNRLVRMVYASKASFKPFDTEHGIDGNVAHILATARRRNRKNGLVGALYYGNGFFSSALKGNKVLSMNFTLTYSSIPDTMTSKSYNIWILRKLAFYLGK
jgi:hypothetical protein